MGKWLALLAVVALALAGCGADDAALMPADTEVSDGVVVENLVPVDVEEVGGSGVSGSAEVSRADDVTTLVELELDGADAEQGAVHRGTCEDLGERAFDLTGLRTTIPVAMETLTNEPHAIAVHVGGDVVACGGIS